MTRYSVKSSTIPLDEIVKVCMSCGAHDVQPKRHTNVVFCDMNQSVAEHISSKGCVVKPVSEIKPFSTVPVYGGIQVLAASALWDLRESFSPVLIGRGVTIAILDSGVRADHIALNGKVTREENFTTFPTAEDVFNHGTGVSYAAAGGEHAIGQESGAAPGATIWNMKVLGDTGVGSDEWAIDAIERIIDLREQALASGKSELDPEVPNIINMSWGHEDDGDPDNPIRMAARAAVDAGMAVVAAAGNIGPGGSSITLPATDPRVLAVGAMTLDPLLIWQNSSRGPTVEGYVKPDVVFFGTNLLVASNSDIHGYVVKSGTSFSAPYMSGILALATEALHSVLQQPVSMGEVTNFVLLFTVKPTDDPLAISGEKDNVYGYGMPFGKLISQSFGVDGAGSQITEMFAGLVPLMLVGGLLKVM